MSETKPKSRNKKKRFVRRIVILLLLLALAAFIGWRVYEGLKSEYTVVYDSYVASTGTISNALSFSGTLALIPYMLNDAAECTLRLAKASLQGKVPEKVAGVRALSDGERRGLFLEGEEGDAVTLWYSSCLLRTELYPYHRIVRSY